MWKIVRRLLAVFIRVFIWHPVVSLVVIVLALGAISFGLGGLSDPQGLRGSSASDATSTSTGVDSSGQPVISVATASAVQANPAPAVDQYIKGMTTFDSKLEWDALDPRAVQAMTTQGVSQQILQQRLDDAKQNGAKYDEVTFIGGYPLKNGDRYFFYVVSRRGFAGPGVIEQVFYVFTVGPNGKIVKIE
ncbi:MAG TPA: hypothetical protein VKT80_13125 [Chloroflexota bacterium]|nr:hypothetical protein [Chloroflexota bacterium]